MTHAEQQEQLGDPSGQSSAEYWDEWFQKISPDDGFDWYCHASEIARILLFSMTQQLQHKQQKKEELCILHPGSGNSSVPFRLRDEYGFSSDEKCARQCIIDCSIVAIQQMKDRAAAMQHLGLIEYEVGDVLHPPLPYSDQTFDAWVDKGLVDALFCGDDTMHEIQQCTTLLNEAHRVLKRNGICIIVSLAQEHTLNLILHASGLICAAPAEGAITEAPQEPTCGPFWTRPIEIHQVKPLSDASSLRPFAFVLRNLSSLLQEDERSTLNRSDSCTVDDQQPVIVLFDANGIVCGSMSRKNFSFESVKKMIQASQEKFLEQWKLAKADMSINSNEFDLIANNNDKSNNDDLRYILATIHIKPWDVETNLLELKERIKNSKEYNNLGLAWKKDEIKAIGFGIFSLQMSLVIPEESLEDLCECIATQEEEFVQSVDIDWQSACRVVTNASKLMSAAR